MYLVNGSNEMLQDKQPTEVLMVPENSNSRWRRGVLAILMVLAVAFVVTAGMRATPRIDLDWLSRLAHSGHADAQLQLGLAYRDGRFGLSPDAKTGLYWLTQAANSGNAYAEDAVGEAYAKGQGTAADPQLASQWLRKAMQAGNHAARIHLSEVLMQTGHLNQAEQLLL